MPGAALFGRHPTHFSTGVHTSASLYAFIMKYIISITSIACSEVQPLSPKRMLFKKVLPGFEWVIMGLSARKIKAQALMHMTGR